MSDIWDFLRTGKNTRCGKFRKSCIVQKISSIFAKQMSLPGEPQGSILGVGCVFNFIHHLFPPAQRCQPCARPHSLRPGPPVIQAPLRALCSEIPKTHGRSSERQRCSLRAQSITAGTARHKSSPRLSAFSNRLKILQRPTDEFLKDWQQAAPQLCQRILHLRRYLGILPPADQPVHLQSFQCIRQNFRRYVRNRLGDGVETGVFIL